VYIGYNKPREIVCIGSMKIRIHDNMMRILTDARHIPSMDKNLIYLNSLYFESCKNSGSIGVLSVSNASLVHMIM
jgi:hypothetical protein